MLGGNSLPGRPHRPAPYRHARTERSSTCSPGIRSSSSHAPRASLADLIAKHWHDPGALGGSLRQRAPTSTFRDPCCSLYIVRTKIVLLFQSPPPFLAQEAH